MCYPFDAKPPIAPLAGAALDSERLTLRSEDGTKFLAFAAHPTEPGPGAPAIVVMPDVRGLFSFYEELALRFAEHGTDAITIDYFGRTTALDGSRGEEFDFMEHIAQTSPPTVAMDVRAAIEYLRGRGPAGRPIFSVGFCFGGTHSWLQAAAGHGLAGSVGFYGMPVSFQLAHDPVAPITRVESFECPVLGLMGGADPHIPNEHSDEFDRALSAAGVEHEITVYSGAPHGFFDRQQAEYQTESDDAWRRIEEFIASVSGSA